MTSKLTREQLHERARENVKALKMASRQTAFESAREEIMADLQLAELALAAMDSEPVAEVLSNRPGNDSSTIDRALPVGTQLYRHAQPVPVVSADLLHTAASAIEDLLTTKDRTRACVWFDLPFRLRSAANAQPAPAVPEDVLDALLKVARIRLDLNDFDGDRRGIADCLGDAEEALIEVVNRRAAMLAAAPQEDINALIPLVSRNEQEGK
ncbi:hypothetical protein [Klebsiella pneumoniae]|uniref:hypothetical protein n=1 Tax=Klebsiella pneumoniae TaxID=573 RepID=UPI000690BEB5|nr:hypothetical protein [Klebsiella pneumoniae]